MKNSHLLKWHLILNIHPLHVCIGSQINRQSKLRMGYERTNNRGKLRNVPQLFIGRLHVYISSGTVTTYLFSFLKLKQEFQTRDWQYMKRFSESPYEARNVSTYDSPIIKLSRVWQNSWRLALQTGKVRNLLQLRVEISWTVLLYVVSHD